MVHRSPEPHCSTERALKMSGSTRQASPITHGSITQRLKVLLCSKRPHFPAMPTLLASSSQTTHGLARLPSATAYTLAKRSSRRKRSLETPHLPETHGSRRLDLS